MNNTENLPDQLSAGQTRVIPVIQEELTVEKKTIETGSVLISKKVHEEESVLDVLTTSEEVIVEKKEINQYIDVAPPAIRQEGDVTIISVVKEVLVVEKRLMLVEELHVTKLKTTDSTVIRETVRREEVHISRSTPGTEF